jgi:hypothetical protein
MVDRAKCLFLGIEGFLHTLHMYMYPSQAAIPTCAYIDSTSGLVWRTVLRPHTSASSVLPSPLPTRMSLHHLTPSHIPHMPSLLLDVQRLSRVLSRVRHGASGRPCAPFPHPTSNVSLTPDDASMQTQAAGPEGYGAQCTSPVYRTMVHSARTPTTRPLPRPAAIASRHATSRAMRIPSALLVSQAAPAALFSPHSPCRSLVVVHASPHARPYTGTPRGEGGGWQTPTEQEARVDAITRACCIRWPTPSSL